MSSRFWSLSKATRSSPTSVSAAVDYARSLSASLEASASSPSPGGSHRFGRGGCGLTVPPVSPRSPPLTLRDALRVAPEPSRINAVVIPGARSEPRDPAARGARSVQARSVRCFSPSLRCGAAGSSGLGYASPGDDDGERKAPLPAGEGLGRGRTVSPRSHRRPSLIMAFVIPGARSEPRDPAAPQRSGGDLAPARPAAFAAGSRYCAPLGPGVCAAAPLAPG